MAVLEDPVFITFEHGQEEAERQIKLLCTRLLPAWTNLDISKIQVSPISGGISNLLVKVEPPLPCLPVAVKVFGDKTELLIDREAERQLLLKLNAVGFGAKVIALFANGRVEEFLEATTLTPENVADPRFIPHIARRVRIFHDLDLSNGGIPTAAAAVTVPNHQSSTTTTVAYAESVSSRPSTHWEFIFDWLRMAEGLSFPNDPVKQAAFDRVDLDRVRQEITNLRHMCDRVNSPKVMCHNDLLPGNILIVRQSKSQKQEPQQQRQEEAQGKKPEELEAPTEITATANGSHHTNGQLQEECNGLHVNGNGCATAGKEDPDRQHQNGGDEETSTNTDDVFNGGILQFIDFEYSCFGPRGFDFGNHFNEYAGFDGAYDKFPNMQQQKAFFRHYLLPGELRRLAKQLAASGPVVTEGSGAPNGGGAAALTAPSPAVNGGYDDVGAAEELVLERLCAEACVYALMSHAYWCVWSYIQARYSPIDFDYLGYSKMRWAEYYRRKDEFFALVDRLYPRVPSS